MLRDILICWLIVVVISVGYVFAFPDVPDKIANPEASDNIRYNVVIEGSGTWIFGDRVSTGSGVLVSEDGLVLTARHMVKNVDSVRVTLAKPK